MKTWAWRRLAVIVLATAWPLPGVCDPQGSPARELAVLINQYRRAQGLLALKVDSRLEAAAYVHSSDMATENFFSHVGSDGSYPPARLSAAGYSPDDWGETIAAGSSSPAAILQSWQNSPPHNAIMLGGGYLAIGCGYAYEAASTYDNYWTADFAAEIGSYPLVIGDDEETTADRAVVLSVPAPSGSQEMRFRNESGPWSAWEAYHSAKSWELSSGGGLKTVYSEVRCGSAVFSSSDDVELAGGSPDRPVIQSGKYIPGGSSIALFRPSQGAWLIRDVTRAYLGASSDIPVSGDYDGDGTAEIGVYRPATSCWTVAGVTRTYLGSPDDVPVPADYDGDGRCDPATFRPSTGLWAIGSLTRFYFGAYPAVPVPGDYCGNGTASPAVFRPSDASWIARDLTRFQFGETGDIPVPGRWETEGAPSWSAAVYRSGEGMWAIRDVTRRYLGGPSDLPAPADYSGTGSSAVAIFRPGEGLWAIPGLTRAYFGTAGDIPVTR